MAFVSISRVLPLSTGHPVMSSKEFEGSSMVFLVDMERGAPLAMAPHRLSSRQVGGFGLRRLNVAKPSV